MFLIAHELFWWQTTDCDDRIVEDDKYTYNLFVNPHGDCRVVFFVALCVIKVIQI